MTVKLLTAIAGTNKAGAFSTQAGELFESTAQHEAALVATEQAEWHGKPTAAQIKAEKAEKAKRAPPPAAPESDDDAPESDDA